MKRIVSLLLLIFFALPMMAEAAPNSLQTADREMKRDRYYTPSSLYERSHALIYGRGRSYGADGRPTIAVIINGDETILAEERVKSEIYSMLRKKFPREDFALLKGNRIITKLLQHMEDEYGSIGKIDKSSLDDHSTQDIIDLRREDYVRAGQECGYDYVFVATLSHGEERSESHDFLIFSNKTNKKNVWLQVRLIDLASGDYLYRNDLVLTGKTHSGRVNGRVMQRSVHKAMKEAMDDIEISYS